MEQGACPRVPHPRAKVGRWACPRVPKWNKGPVPAFHSKWNRGPAPAFHFPYRGREGVIRAMKKRRRQRGFPDVIEGVIFMGTENKKEQKTMEQNTVQKNTVQKNSVQQDTVHQQSPWTAKRVAAVIGIVLLVALYVVTLVSAFIGTEGAGRLFKFSLGMTVAVPIFLWIFIWCVGKLQNKKSMASLDILSSNPAERKKMEDAIKRNKVREVQEDPAEKEEQGESE